MENKHKKKHFAQWVSKKSGTKKGEISRYNIVGSGKHEGASVVIIHKMRKERLENFEIPLDFTDDELQDYILFNKLPNREIPTPTLTKNDRKAGRYYNYLRGDSNASR